MAEPTDRAVYVISVAAELAGVHPQTLRIYERKGLVDPARTGGGSRRYSDDDIELLRRIQELTSEGLNLAGVQRVLELEAELAELRAKLDAERQAPTRPSTRPIASTGATSCRSSSPSSCSGGSDGDRPEPVDAEDPGGLHPRHRHGEGGDQPRGHPRPPPRRPAWARPRRRPPHPPEGRPDAPGRCATRADEALAKLPKAYGSEAAPVPRAQRHPGRGRRDPRRAARRVPLHRAPPPGPGRPPRRRPGRTCSPRCRRSGAATGSPVQNPEDQYQALEKYGRDLTEAARHGQARPGHRARRGDPPRHPGAVPAHQEQPGAHRRARRGQDRHRRGPGPPHRRGRRARER